VVQRRRRNAGSTAETRRRIAVCGQTCRPPRTDDGSAGKRRRQQGGQLRQSVTARGGYHVRHSCPAPRSFMLSYRHAFHAGNFADVLKHLVLVNTLKYATRKDAPLFYADTHAGAGLYRLDANEAQKTGEAAQ